LPPNPIAGYSGQQLGSGGRAEQHGVFAEQEWVRGNKLGLNRQVAAQEVAKAEHRYQVQCQRVRTDLRIAFYQVLVAQRQQQLATQIREIASQGLSNAERLFQAKEVGRGDVVQARIEFENAQILVDNSANRAAAAWRSLAAVTGVPGLAEQPLLGALDSNLPDYTFNDTLQQILACSPEIAVASAEAERARWALQRAGVEKTPNVTFQGLVNWQDNGINGDPDGSVIASLPLPLWNRNQGGVSKAYAEIAAAEQALTQLELSLQNRLAPVFERYANARQQVVRYQTVILPAAEEALALVQRTYQASETNYASLLVAQRTFVQTRLGYLEALQNLRESQSQIDGMLLSGSLESQ
jgi:cobalt-zinc-cadmium efflux system outer membrane protein